MSLGWMRSGFARYLSCLFPECIKRLGTGCTASIVPRFPIVCYRLFIIAGGSWILFWPVILTIAPMLQSMQHSKINTGIRYWPFFRLLYPSTVFMKPNALSLPVSTCRLKKYFRNWYIVSRRNRMFLPVRLFRWHSCIGTRVVRKSMKSIWYSPPFRI